jgi:peroxiredoxin Q/BCP
MIVVIAIGVVGFVAFTPKAQPTQKIGVGSKAPDFSLPDTTGGTFRLSDYRGKTNVLLFFNEGLACAPCLSQMRDLDQINSQLTGLNVLLVSITGDQLSLLVDWAKSSGPQYGLLLSDQSLDISRTYDMLGADVSMMPGTAPGHTFVLVNKAGIIVWRADYGPYNMYIQNNEIIAQVRKTLGG